ncbi:MaoC/PaaZ C-terminal domain-containing protein [Salirhabdus salicampi]|uniref:MaoC/PaaZ C-terminal domain-containing protein n=1 Tax=Salirhabdus salicampi TaxID=476102 RepID=UPI0020C3D7AF|nr:MaoC/PaaZ C-terminal domain-containing protein [Salirhabdus salicampi]MCP8617092.1 MaoC family dehydratase N-terminal domain-containing protein [Salirhabdus salicampi]
MIGKKRKIGRKIQQIQVGDEYEVKRKIEDKDLLLYLALTNDANPLYIQHDYASQTPFKKPVVPSVMLYGLVSSAISMELPGPGSHIVRQQFNYPKPVYHYATITVHIKVTHIDKDNHCITVSVTGIDDEDHTVFNGELDVCPPHEPESMLGKSLENFY